MMPRLLVKTSALSHNASIISEACRQAGTTCLPVMKSAALHPELAKAILAGCSSGKFGTVAWLARSLSSLDDVNLHHIYAPNDALESQPQNFSTVYVSSLYSLKRLHRFCKDDLPAIRICLECGDGRDGILMEELTSFCHEALRLGFSVRGLSINFACMSDKAPTPERLDDAVRALELIRPYAPHADISAGGTDMLEFAKNNALPSSISELRCGSGILLGTYPLSGRHIPDCRQDAFTLEGTVIECRVKEGRKLALLDFGSFHTCASKLTAPVEGMTFLNASSAYSVFDVSECTNAPCEGQTMLFGHDFHSLTCALTSRALRLETLP